MHSYFTQSTNWRDYDVFEALKEKTFFSSCFGVTELATRYRKLVGQLENIEENVLEILFVSHIVPNNVILQSNNNFHLERICRYFFVGKRYRSFLIS